MNPEIEKLYHSELDLKGFGKMLKDPSYCYKFYWLEAVTGLIVKEKTDASFEEVITEMIVNAWYSVTEYHIHLSGMQYGCSEPRDNLERSVIRLQQLTHYISDTDDELIRQAVKEHKDDRVLKKCMTALTDMVPFRALSGFTSQSMDMSKGRAFEYLNSLHDSGHLLPYTFSEEKGLKRKVYFTPAWCEMIRDHAVSILGWIEDEKVRWLQNCNPDMPGLIYKLNRNRSAARKLTHVRHLWDGVMERTEVRDVFTGRVLNDEYDVDHFIPWSFVMNDELWNLSPMDASLNSSKSNRLPKWDTFFSSFADSQYTMYRLSETDEEIHRLFTKCSQDNLHSLWAVQELYRPSREKDEFVNILEKNMKPVYEAARRQGYDIWNTENMR